MRHAFYVTLKQVVVGSVRVMAENSEQAKSRGLVSHDIVWDDLNPITSVDVVVLDESGDEGED